MCSIKNCISCSKRHMSFTTVSLEDFERFCTQALLWQDCVQHSLSFCKQNARSKYAK